MPVFLGAHVLIALAFAVHAVRSGQPIYWLVILFMFPGLGSLVYAVTVVLPGLGQSPQARRAGAAARRLIDPERELRTALHQLEISRTPGNLKRAGEALLSLERPRDALDLYREATEGAFREDAALLQGRAQAEFESGDAEAALQTLEALKSAHPTLRLPGAHLLYARALETAGRREEAFAEYEAVSGYFPGAEAQARWAMALEADGRREAARERWQHILSAARIAPQHARRMQKRWIDLARSRAG